MQGLGRLVVRGGAVMAVRQIIGMGLSVVGLLVVARLIGPQAYGTYASAFAIQFVVQLLCQGGVDVYLMRRDADPTRSELNQAFTLLLTVGLLVALIGWPVSYIVDAWVGIPMIGEVLGTMLWAMPIALVSLVPSAILQRRMAFVPVAWVELAGQAALYAVAIPMAMTRHGVWAPAAGFWAQQVVTSVLMFIRAKYRPGLRLDIVEAKEMLSFGIGYAFSVWSWQARLLVNPLIVARYLGAESAGAVALSIRIADTLCMLRPVAWRLAIAGLARVKAEPERMRHGAGDGMRVLMLTTGPALVFFAFVAPWVVPFAFGADWAPVAMIFPFVALSYLVNCVFTMHSAVLYVLGRTREVTLFHLTSLMLFAISAMAFVPAFGLVGYGYAEIVAMAAYGVSELFVRRQVGSPGTGLGLIWAAGFGLALFAPVFGPLAWLGPVVVVILPATRQTVARYWSMVKEAAHA
jgi:O-antigen/teichoic acid export membrane protein